MTEPDLEDLAYRELKAIASSLFRRERSDHTLQTTALVHEAWLKLAKGGALPTLGSEDERRRFVGFAAHAMRQILVDHARRSTAEKRGGGGAAGWGRVTLAGELPITEFDADLMLDLDAGLDELAARDERVSRVAELHLFGGLPLTEIAEMEGVSAKAARADWALARAVLSKRLRS